jgi:uncharacterized protein (DUF305 family)
MKKYLPLLAFTALLVILLFGGANFYLKNQKSTNPISQTPTLLPSLDGCPAGQSKRQMASMCMVDNQLNPIQSNTPLDGMSKMDMTIMVKDDQTFIQSMIPHHQEAIDTSKIIVSSTNDQDLKAFANQVIIDQTKEVDSMKSWYKALTNSDYKDNGMYMAMMSSIKDKTGFELDKEYIKTMVLHHNGAIEMAKKILPISKSPDIKNLANSVITNQANEVSKLEGWLKNKYNT